MAGRGTDIRLGGRGGDGGQVAALGGLQVIGTGRYWSSRLDNQLRGRSGRQGDPGGSVFFASMEDQLVEHYAPDADPPHDVAADGLVADPGAHWMVDHAQRVAEGANLEIHRNTWRYSKLVEDQRSLVLEQRYRVLTSGAALQALARRCPQRHAELSVTAGPQALDDAARQIVLYHLDAGWADHLAALAGIREGIHLRSLGRGLNPLNEFHREAVTLFSRLLRDVEERSAETFQTVPITDSGADLGAVGLKRPTATWTYLVQDNPFGTDIDRALRSAGRLLRGPRQDRG
jgi:preprotein translocase subunit SecA